MPGYGPAYKVDYVIIHPSRLLNFFLNFQEKAENSSISVPQIMGSKNACALEFASILGRHNIKCSVNIIYY